MEKEDDILSKEEVECQSAAVRAIYNLEIKDILSLMRLLRSKFNDEQLHIPVVQYFRENLPNLAVVRNEDDTHVVKRKEADGNLSADQFNGRNLHVSLLRRLSMAYPDCSNAVPSFDGFESSSKSVKTTLFGAENMQIKQFVCNAVHLLFATILVVNCYAIDLAIPYFKLLWLRTHTSI